MTLATIGQQNAFTPQASQAAQVMQNVEEVLLACQYESFEERNIVEICRRTLENLQGYFQLMGETNPSLLKKHLKLEKRCAEILARPKFVVEHVGCKLEPTSGESALVQLVQVIQKHPELDHGLRYSLQMGARPCIHFYHNYLELRNLIDKFPDLRPFFVNFHEVPGGSFFRGLNIKYQASDMGLIERRDDKENMLRCLIPSAQEELQRMKRSRVECDFSDSVHSSFEALIETIYQNFPGVVVGEKHDQIGAKKFLINLMPLLGKLGVTLLIDGCCRETMQPFIDEYLNSETEEMPVILRQQLELMDNAYLLTSPYTYVDLFREAKKNKVQVLAMDTITGIWALDSGADARKAVHQREAVRILQHDQPKRFLCFCGGMLASTALKKSKEKDGEFEEIGPPGLSELLQVPSIVVMHRWSQSLNFPNRYFQFKVKPESGERPIYFAHFYIEQRV